jgi:SAM-dependent methyltransferase
MPRGLRNTREWYHDVDPMSQVDETVLDLVVARAGPRVLDLGGGLGGYSRALTERGFESLALDVNEEYVKVAQSIGVQAELYDGERVPLDDGAVDTVIAIEVLEHLDDPGRLLREAARLSSRNVVVTTPNCTQDFAPAPIEFSHMLDVDHRQFFTVETLRELFESSFQRCEVLQFHPLDQTIAALVLPGPLRPLYRGLARIGAVRPRYFFHLLGEGWVTR